MSDAARTAGDGASCAMASLVEARHDDRLGDAEAASMDRHLEVCAPCRELSASLADLGDLARLDPVARPTPLEHRRARLALLQRAAAPLEERRGRAPRWVGLAAAALVVGAGAAAFAATGRAVGPPLVAAAASARADGIAVHAADARVRRVAGSPTVYELDAGCLTIRSKQRVRVRVADVWVTGQGAFSVEAEEARLERVLVTSGSVEVRDADRTRVVAAGGEWSRNGGDRPSSSSRSRLDASSPDGPRVASTGTPNAPATEVAVTGHSVAPATVVAVHAAAKTEAARNTLRDPTPAAAPQATEPAASAPLAAATPPPASTGFRDAMKLLERGAYDDATARLRAFRRSNPADARAEDASFLEIVALQRAGRQVEAQSAARRYLDAYPGGFRRAEAQRIASSQ